MLEALLEILGGVLEGLCLYGRDEASDAGWHPAVVVLLVVLVLISMVACVIGALTG